MDWDKMTTRVRGASAFWRGLGKVVPTIQKFFLARLGDGALFCFWLDEWSNKWSLRGKFPRLFAITRHPQGTVRECWDGGWSPSLAVCLLDQRLEEFLSMQQMLEGWRPREGARDGWIWRKDVFSVCGLYQQLRTSQSADPAVLNACCAVWKQMLPHKVAVFVWTIARQWVLTQVRHRHLFSTGSALRMLCREQVEDYEHLFFKCPIARKAWASQGLSNITSTSVFWATILRRRRGHEADQGQRFAVV